MVPPPSSPAAKLAEQMETIDWPIDGFALACDVCGEAEPLLFFEQPGNLIVCKKHRRES